MDAGPESPTGRPWRALLVLCLGNFLILLDTTIVNTAAPEIMRSLDTGIDTMLWVLNGYLLAFASQLILFGRLGDLVGPRRLFVLGLGVFTVASLLCGAATSPGQLVAARVVQGVGAAALLPQALVLIAAIFPSDRRGAAFGIFTAVAGIAAVSGPTLGGLAITELGWQWIFYVNVPLGLAGMALTLRLVPDLRTVRPHRYDVVGVLLATLSVLGIVYGLVEGERHRWGRVVGPVSIPLILVVAMALAVAFVRWERNHPEPLVPLELFRDRNFSIATAIAGVTSFALYGFLLVFVIETQTLLGMSPLASGVAALPLTLVLSAVAPVAGRLTDRVGGRRLLVIGLASYALGMLGLAVLPTSTSGAAIFVLPLALVGIGIGASIAPTTTEAMRDISPAQAGAASGVLNTARQVGGGLGAAVVGAVLQNRLLDSLHEAAGDPATPVPPALRTELVEGIDAAAAHGLNLGGGRAGGVPVPADLPPDLASQFQRLAVETFDRAFLPAARPTLMLVAMVLLAGCLLAARMRTAGAGAVEGQAARR